MHNPFANPAYQAAQQAAHRGDYETADAICREMLTTKRNDVAALSMLGQLAYIHRRFDEAADYLRQCIKQFPKNPGFHIDLARICNEAADHRQAIRHADAALRLQPDLPNAIIVKGLAYERLGKYDQIRRVLGRSVSGASTPPGIAAVYMRMLIHRGESDEAIDLGRAVADAATEASFELRDVLFALADAYERSGEFGRAFETAMRANAMLAVPFDRNAHRTLIDELIEATTNEKLAAIPRAVNTSDLPILLVGMPRCGSTLVERIIHTHPDAFGAGETIALEEVIRSLPARIESDTPYPTCMAELTQDVVNSAAEDYLAALRAMNGRASRIVDKHLINYRHLGLANVLLPAGRVIDCRRDPVNVCLSCFMARLSPAGMPYAGSLEDLGFYHRQYERLMTHYHEVLDIPMLKLSYESIIADQEAQTRALLEFCGLDWDDRCLRFHETKRVDNTLSYDQVRKPLYDSSRDRAATFGSLLDPLREALGAGV